MPFFYKGNKMTNIIPAIKSSVDTDELSLIRVRDGAKICTFHMPYEEAMVYAEQFTCNWRLGGALEDPKVKVKDVNNSIKKGNELIHEYALLKAEGGRDRKEDGKFKTRRVIAPINLIDINKEIDNLRHRVGQA